MAFYADTYFVLNFIADFLLLTASGCICAVFTPKWRIFAAAIYGAFYSVFAFLGPEIFSRIFMYLISAGIMLVIAFGAEKRFLKLYIVFFSLTAAFGGTIYAVNVSMGENILYRAGKGSSLVFVFVFLTSHFLFSVVFKRSARDGTMLSTVEIFFKQKSVVFRALQDTGNSLTDPLTGRKVMVTSFERVKTLFPEIGLTFYEKNSASDIVEKVNSSGYSFFLVPYKAVGTESGLLAAFKPDKVLIDGKISDGYIVAISPNDVGNGGAYTALMGAA